MNHRGQPITPKGHNTKEMILEKAFHLFMVNGYEKTTIAELIRMTGVSRGAIFYYYRDKFTLYQAVIDRFVISAQHMMRMVEVDEQTTFLDFIHRYVNVIEQTTSRLARMMVNPETGQSEYQSMQYYYMIFEAASIHPSYTAAVQEIFDSEHEICSQVLRRDIERGLVREEVDIAHVVRHLRYLYMGLSMECAFYNQLDTQLLLRIALDLYEAIKK